MTSFGSSVCCCDQGRDSVQQRGRSVKANISGGRKHSPSCIVRLFHSWL